MTDQQKLFVGGLPWSLTEQEFAEAFGVFGPVEEVKIVYDRETKRSRGFGFVRYKSADDARVARDEMHDTELKGRQIRVDFAEQKERPPRTNGGRGGPPDKRRRTRRSR